MTPVGARAPRLRVRARSIVVATLVVAAVLVTAWVLGRATRVLGWVMAAVVLAALLHPLVEALALRIPRPLALVTVLLSVAGLTALVVWASVGDLQHGLQRLRVAAPETAADLESRRSWIGDAARQFGLQQRVKDFLDDIPARLAGGSPGAAVRAAASRGIAVLITIVLTLFLMSHGPRLLRGLLRQLPEDRRPVVSAALFHGYRRAWGYLVAIARQGGARGLRRVVPVRPPAAAGPLRARRGGRRGEPRAPLRAGARCRAGRAAVRRDRRRRAGAVGHRGRRRAAGRATRS